MSATATYVNATPLETGLGLLLNNVQMELQIVTKLSGDTTLTVTPQYLNYVQSAWLLTGNTATPTPLALDTAAAYAITNTQGSVSVAITAITTGANTVNGLVILVGLRNPIHPA